MIRRVAKSPLAIVAGFFCLGLASNVPAFEGKIVAEIKEGETDTTPLLYTVGANFLRIEVSGKEWPHPIDIVDLKSGAVILIYPHNRSFMRSNPANEPGSGSVPGGLGAVPSRSPWDDTAVVAPKPTVPAGLPPGIGPQPPGSISGPILPGMPPMPMPMRPSRTTEKIELKPTGKTEEILGYPCQQFEIKSRGEMMEIWATDKLIPFKPYLRTQPERSTPRMIDEQWAALLTAKRLFPLRASLRFNQAALPSLSPPEKRDESVSVNGAERFRFEVKSIEPGKIEDKQGKLFQPPEGYMEIEPAPP